MPQIDAKTRAGRLCQALSTSEWRDCFDVTEEQDFTLAGCTKLFGELYRKGYLLRRDSTKNNNAEYEYKLCPDVEITGSDEKNE